MHPKRLIKHFPELAQLPTYEQENIIREAQTRLENNTHRLHALRDNLLRAGLLFGFCLLIIEYAPLVVGVSQATTAIVIMAVVIPAYLVIQQQLYLRKLRIALTQSSPLFQQK